MYAPISNIVASTFGILCPDWKVGRVLGMSGSILQSLRRDTDTWIRLHKLLPGDGERLIEITYWLEPGKRILALSPAQVALFFVHGFIHNLINEKEEYMDRVISTRLVVPREHSGCLLGEGGAICKQMTSETQTKICILRGYNSFPQCVNSEFEDIVQVVGPINSVKVAVAIILWRLRERQLRDHCILYEKPPERFLPLRFFPQVPVLNCRRSNHSSRSSGFDVETGAPPIADSAQPFYGDGLVFRMLCPIDKVDRVIGESEGMVELLQNEVGVDFKVADPVSGSDEQIITISSEKGPDDRQFPAQEALLRFQTCIVDCDPDKDNIIKTRLLVPSSEVGCLEGIDGSLSEMERLTGAKIQILPKEELPTCASGTDELVQIEGERKAAREALIEVTLRLRSSLYIKSFQKDTPPPLISAPSSVRSSLEEEATSPNNLNTTSECEALGGGEPPAAHQNVQSTAPSQPSKDVRDSGIEAVLKQNESEGQEDVPTTAKRIPVSLVTRIIHEVVIPEYAVPKLVMESENKLAQISEMSGANIILEKDKPDVTEKTVQISGTSQQRKRAQSLLEEFISSIQEDYGP